MLWCYEQYSELCLFTSRFYSTKKYFSSITYGPIHARPIIDEGKSDNDILSFIDYVCCRHAEIRWNRRRFRWHFTEDDTKPLSKTAGMAIIFLGLNTITCVYNTNSLFPTMRNNQTVMKDGVMALQTNAEYHIFKLSSVSSLLYLIITFAEGRESLHYVCLLCVCVNTTRQNK